MVVDIPGTPAKGLANQHHEIAGIPQTAIRKAQMLDCSEQIDAHEGAWVAYAVCNRGFSHLKLQAREHVRRREQPNSLVEFCIKPKRSGRIGGIHHYPARNNSREDTCQASWELI
jgi:hypothetical protein